MFKLFHSPAPAVSRGGFYVHVTTPDGITHLVFKREKPEAERVYRALFASFNVEPKFIEVK